MSGNLVPGGDFAPTGSVATYAAEVVTSAVLEGVVKEAALALIRQVIMAEAKQALLDTIVRLVPSP